MTFAGYMMNSFNAIQYMDFFLRILVACVCGGVIGYERSVRLKEAGLRTHIIVCCAAAFMMIVSKYGFADLATAAASGVDVLAKSTDPARIAAQIVTGVSFLGAGIIFHSNNDSVKGLSTAAGVWATAGIGMAIGAGMYLVGLFATVILFMVQWGVRKFERDHDSVFLCRLCFTVKDTEQFRKVFDKYISEHNGHVTESTMAMNEHGGIDYTICVKSAGESAIEDLSRLLEENGEIKSISYTTI